MLDLVSRGAETAGYWRATARRIGPALRIVPVLLGTTLWPVFAGAQSWVLTDIGALGGLTSSDAKAVSDAGQVVGSYATQGNGSRAFSWTPWAARWSTRARWEDPRRWRRA
jgi:probable HAF family extracellular repeat protein